MEGATFGWRPRPSPPSAAFPFPKAGRRPTAASHNPKVAARHRLADDRFRLPRAPESAPSGLHERQQEPINPTLTFELKLDPGHPYLDGEVSRRTRRGLRPRHCGRGMMTGRVCIPIHNERGELVAYAGRWVGPDEAIPEGEGRYKLPPKFRKAACCST